MLVELTVENLAIIERAQLSLGPGFTVLTGETGAGKSLLVDALQLVLGDRADTELVRTGAAKAIVSVVVDLSSRPDVATAIRDLGFELDEERLHLQREVFAEGRSIARVAGRTTPIATLRQIGGQLVDLHGQHDHQSLLDPERHVEFLDAWIGAPLDTLKQVVRETYGHADARRKELAALRAGVRDREQRLDLRRYQIDEIEAANPIVGEMEELETQMTRLKHAERLMTAAATTLNALSDADDNARDHIGLALSTLEGAARLDPSLDGIIESLRAAAVHLDEATATTRDYVESLESEPGRLEEVADRIDLLKRLRRKYGDDEAAILAFLAEARVELELLSDVEANLEDLERAVEDAHRRLLAACSELTQLRKARASQFAELVADTLRELAMEKARFVARIDAKDPATDGADVVEFDFSANVGEVPKPLSKIASGGEMSRVMLAIKTALAGRAGVPTLIFDEVDAGLSGRAAASVARQLQGLSTHYQVLVISHLPQIASLANTHFRIEKSEANGRVLTQVVPLDNDERVEEIARMVTGETITQEAMDNARRLLNPSLF